MKSSSPSLNTMDKIKHQNLSCKWMEGLMDHHLDPNAGLRAHQCHSWDLSAHADEGHKGQSKQVALKGRLSEDLAWRLRSTNSCNQVHFKFASYCAMAKGSVKAVWAQNASYRLKWLKSKWLLLCRANGTHCSYCTTDKYSYLILVIMQNSACSKVGRSKGSCPRNDDVILGSVKECPFSGGKVVKFLLRFDLQYLFHKPMCLVRHKLTVQQLHLPSLSIASSSCV